MDGSLTENSNTNTNSNSNDNDTISYLSRNDSQSFLYQPSYINNRKEIDQEIKDTSFMKSSEMSIIKNKKLNINDLDFNYETKIRPTSFNFTNLQINEINNKFEYLISLRKKMTFNDIKNSNKLSSKTLNNIEYSLWAKEIEVCVKKNIMRTKIQNLYRIIKNQIVKNAISLINTINNGKILLNDKCPLSIFNSKMGKKENIEFLSSTLGEVARKNKKNVEHIKNILKKENERKIKTKEESDIYKIINKLTMLELLDIIRNLESEELIEKLGNNLIFKIKDICNVDIIIEKIFNKKKNEISYYEIKKYIGGILVLLYNFEFFINNKEEKEEKIKQTEKEEKNENYTNNQKVILDNNEEICENKINYINRIHTYLDPISKMIVI